MAWAFGGMAGEAGRERGEGMPVGGEGWGAGRERARGRAGRGGGRGGEVGGGEVQEKADVCWGGGRGCVCVRVCLRPLTHNTCALCTHLSTHARTGAEFRDQQYGCSAGFGTGVLGVLPGYLPGNTALNPRVSGEGRGRAEGAGLRGG